MLKIASALAFFSLVSTALGCNPGFYKTITGGCTACPAGTYDTNNGNGFFATSCTPCAAGRFNSQTGQTQCLPCDDGYFTSDTGSKECCECCTGYYSAADFKSCSKCTSPTLFSPPGSSSGSACTSGNSANVPQTCIIGGDNKCPAIVKNGPEGSTIKRRRDVIKCTRGYKSCPVTSGVGGWECVDTANDAEMCGGCITGDAASGQGRDCTAISGVSVSRCVKSQCVIDTCRKGYTKSEDGKSCQAVQRFAIQQTRRSSKF